MILHTYLCAAGEAEGAALAFSAILSIDKGVASEVTPVAGGFKLTATDGREVVFLESAPSREPERT